MKNKNEIKKEIKEEDVKESEVFTSVKILKSDLNVLGLENKKGKEVREEIRNKLGLSKIVAQTRKAKALAKLGLTGNVSSKDVWAKILEESEKENKVE